MQDQRQQGRINIDNLDTLLGHLRNAAIGMLDTGMYIRRELPSLELDEARRTEIDNLCGQLLGTGHDIMHEMSEISEMKRDGLEGDRINETVIRVLGWIRDDLHVADPIVRGLQSDMQKDQNLSDVFVLLAESMLNIWQPFNRSCEASGLFPPKDASSAEH